MTTMVSTMKNLHCFFIQCSVKINLEWSLGMITEFLFRCSFAFSLTQMNSNIVHESGKHSSVKLPRIDRPTFCLFELLFGHATENHNSNRQVNCYWVCLKSSIHLSGMTVSTVAEELRHNPRLTKSKEEFVEIMKSLGLTKPKKMGKTLCGWTIVYWMLHVCLLIFWHLTVNSRNVNSYTRRRAVSFCWSLLLFFMDFYYN